LDNRENFSLSFPFKRLTGAWVCLAKRTGCRFGEVHDPGYNLHVEECRTSWDVNKLIFVRPNAPILDRLPACIRKSFSEVFAVEKSKVG